MNKLIAILLLAFEMIAEAESFPLGKRLNFTWDKVTTNVDGTPWTDRGGYRFYESLNGSPWFTRAGIHPDYAKLSYQPLIPGNYRFRVTAITRYSRPRLESAPSNIVAVTIEAPPVVPSPTPTQD